MHGFKLILTPPVTSGGGAIARRPDGRQSEKHRTKGGGAIACGLLLTCVYGCRVHVISCVFFYPIMHPVRIQAKIVRSVASMWSFPRAPRCTVSTTELSTEAERPALEGETTMASKLMR